MSAKNNISLRDFFAAQELAKKDEVSCCDKPEEYQRLAEHCYRMADAMLNERAKSIVETKKQSSGGFRYSARLVREYRTSLDDWGVFYKKWYWLRWQDTGIPVSVEYEARRVAHLLNTGRDVGRTTKW